MYPLDTDTARRPCWAQRGQPGETGISENTTMIIGFCGNLHCGKSSAAVHLATYHRFGVHRFAGTLKEMAKCLGLSPQQVDGDLKETPDHEILGGKTPRYFMQRLGTEFGREMIDQDLWLNAWKATMPKGFDGIACDDVRFQNEADYIRSQGGYLIRVERDMEDNFERSHESEGQNLGPYHATIYNNGTLEDLGHKVDNVLMHLKAM